MGLARRLENLLPDLLGTLRRFPVAALAAFAVTAFVNIFSIGSNTRLDWNVILAGGAAFFAGLAGHLIAEGRDMGRINNLLLASAMALVAAAVTYYNRFFQTSDLYLFAGLGLSLMVAPFLHAHARQGAVWLFNLRLGLAALLAVIVGLVVGLGLSAVVEGIRFLFEFKYSGTFHERIWSLAILLVGPLYGLGLLPRALHEEINLSGEENALLERGVSVLVNYVLVPLVVIYALILHAYAVKIVINGALPKGEIGIIVSIFTIVGTAAWLIGWPWRDRGTRLLRLFMRFWFWLIPVPAVLLSMAIWRRVAEYGMTPNRYGVAIIAVWTALVFFYLLWRRNRADIRFIIASVALLLLGASLGPQGAHGVSERSQFKRLTEIFQNVGLLKDGKVVGKFPSGKIEDGNKANSILYALADVGALDRVMGLFPDGTTFKEAEQPHSSMWRNGNWALTHEISEKLGLSFGNLHADQVTFTPRGLIDTRVAAGTRLVGSLWFGAAAALPELADVKTEVKDGQFVITVKGETHSISVVSLMKQLLEAQKATSEINKQPPLRIVIDDKLGILVTEAYGRSGEAAELNSMHYWLLLSE